MFSCLCSASQDAECDDQLDSFTPTGTDSTIHKSASPAGNDSTADRAAANTSPLFDAEVLFRDLACNQDPPAVDDFGFLSKGAKKRKNRREMKDEL